MNGQTYRQTDVRTDGRTERSEIFCKGGKKVVFMMVALMSFLTIGGTNVFFILGGTNVMVGQMANVFFYYRWDKCHGGTNVLYYYRWDKCQGGTNVLCYYRWDKCQVGQMSVGQMSVGLVSVGQKSRHPKHLTYNNIKVNIQHYIVN